MTRKLTFEYIRDPEEITRQSFSIIRREVNTANIPSDLFDVVCRMVHASGMTDIVGDLSWSVDFAATAREALVKGTPILTDSRMVLSGITRSRLPSGNNVVCTLSEVELKRPVTAEATTRSAAGVDLWLPYLDGALCVIGNAPTALFRLLELLNGGAPSPAAVIATPPGFVGAVESKQALVTNSRGVPYLTLHGRRGGSAVAAAAVNALAHRRDMKS